jgi:LuxR family transcriptional regulator, regulator of acetate metabolism
MSAERIRRLAEASRALHACETVDALLARAAAIGCEVCGFERGVVLTVDEGHLTAGESGALEDGESDRLRRQVLAEPVVLAPGTVEVQVVRSQMAATRAGGASPLADALGLRELLLAAVVPDAWPVALVVLDRAEGQPDALELSIGEVFAALVAAQLERVIQRARLTDLVSEVRHFHASAGALAREVLDGPATLPLAAPAPPVVRFDGSGAEGQRLRELLTDAELRIATLLAQGRSNRQIADQLVLSPETVKTHVGRLLRKVGASNRAEAVYRLVQLGRVDAGDPPVGAGGSPDQG